MNGEQKFWLGICLILSVAGVVTSYFEWDTRVRQSAIEQEEATKRTKERMEWNPWYHEGTSK